MYKNVLKIGKAKARQGKTRQAHTNRQGKHVRPEASDDPLGVSERMTPNQEKNQRRDGNLFNNAKDKKRNKKRNGETEKDRGCETRPARAVAAV